MYIRTIHSHLNFLSSLLNTVNTPRSLYNIILEVRSLISICYRDLVYYTFKNPKTPQYTKMQIQAFFLAGLALATSAVADRLLVTTACPSIGRCSSTGEWINESGGHYWIDANEGCRDPDVPYIYNVCMDWGNGRAHFNADGQNKRCLKRTSPDLYAGPCADTSLQCYRQWWDEVPCSW
ncbi:hypothetical protein B0J11DRAFT_169883 [Dendryphion nanum]|uniref:Uncharacterized protein n=1 Tax=Dendryphion nanum TaxID=256645 RepID=A0A9P9IW41_9PLEO|nr:hypothetical protein B0J11DRAFT_169883 [Dendryphion nanum]